MLLVCEAERGARDEFAVDEKVNIINGSCQRASVRGWRRRRSCKWGEGREREKKFEQFIIKGCKYVAAVIYCLFIFYEKQHSQLFFFATFLIPFGIQL